VTAKLAPGSILTTTDQLQLYREQMGAEAAERQRRLADIEARRCTCTPAKVRRRWENGDKQTTRTVHDASCAKWKPWMAEVRPKEET
jgi:hypothetical protein